MLVEIWMMQSSAGAVVSVDVPADPKLFPRHVYEIDDADWRYLMRFQTGGEKAGDLAEGEVRRYEFQLEDVREILAAAAPLRPGKCEFDFSRSDDAD